MAKKIVIIDDEADVLEIVRAVLTTKGYESVTAQGGEEGLAAVEREKPDLIICDLMMPKVSGLEVIKRLKRHQQHRLIPIIVLSALSAEGEKSPEFWVKTLGVDDYLVKPFDPLDLLGRVEYIFRRQSYRSTTRSEESSATNIAPAPESAAREETDIDYQEAEPVQVVKTFIEAWNTQNFATEYRCLSEEMLGGLEMHDYVARRRQCYYEENGSQHQQFLVNTLDTKIDNGRARIVVEREDVVNGRSRRRKESYTLRKSPGGWKIVMCRPYKATENVV